MADEITIEGQGLGENVSEADRHPTVEESVMAAYDEASYKEAGELDEDSTDEEVSTSTETPTEPDETEEKVEEEKRNDKPERKKKRTVHEMSQALEAPRDWSAEEKEEFNRLPEVGKKAVARIAERFQSHRHRELSAIQQRQQETEHHYAKVRGIVEATERWLPIWGKAGRDPVAATSEILAFADRVRTNPRGAVEELAKSAGIEITVHGGKDTTNGIASTPHVSYEEIEKRIEQKYAQKKQEEDYNTQFLHLKQTATAAIQKLMNETDGAGKYIYPDFHVDEFHAQMEPIAGTIARANPNLSQEEILKRSYLAAGGRVLPRRTTTNPAIPSTRTNFARRAASSYPGSVGISPTQSLEALPGETIEQQVARIYYSTEQ